MACFKRLIEVAVRIASIAERSARQARHAAHVARPQKECESHRGRCWAGLRRCRSRIVVLALLAIRDDGRTGRFELLDRVLDRLCIKALKACVHAVADRSNGIDQPRRAGMLPMARWESPYVFGS